MSQIGTLGTAGGALDEPVIIRWGRGEHPEKIAGEYRTERALRWRLLNAAPSERGALYAAAWEEVVRRCSELPEDRRAFQAATRAHAAAVSRALKRFLDSGTRYLEVGPGDGRLALGLCSTARQVTAVDVRPGFEASAERPPNLTVIVTDGTAVPLPDGAVDVAFTDQLIEHLHPQDAEAIHRDIFRALAPGGVLVCCTPNRLLGPHDLTRYFGGGEPKGLHLKEYSIGDLDRFLRRVGFARVQPLVGARSLWLPAPLWALKALEAVMERLSPPRRQTLDRMPGVGLLLRMLLGARVAAWKAATRP